MSAVSLAKYLFYLYLISSYKSVPGAYFVRFYYYAIRRLILPIFAGKNTKTIQFLQNNELGCFAHSKINTYASPFECDLYFHKNNATYFTELDISRCELMCGIFQKLFLESKKWPFVPVANVFTNFLKEIKPFESYSVTSNILCWDEKWVYVMSKFTKKNNTVLCSLSITKYVLKDGRKTIQPIEALKFCGCYNEKVQKISDQNLDILQNKSGFHETKPLEELDHFYMELV
ncbi:hypothetical protein Kpol_1065p33 [Vanderwaltozyma polyspora DSM 70294]|uniref:Thioesterase domain-containing protein n=1 Tax=Vanderwaltozyma polyspora (strain ATCC 22028 / DSM 70294 / BCRC 21397 / CBS 2163 / NBRC 10782 / NRRL Y-8283 / UCD 57-17) TaxID=436907 RepID=A7TL54_VANPO|nr:uncharacterized protein Kpol_1065p33 [Vanderwaltozyma polyspora DSM 70294]EDO17017.1 hypothetical protein Kpol_1065p33 [Vanderwaltozyma polyspora DSM 70294]